MVFAPSAEAHPDAGWRDKLEHLTRLPSRWQGQDPTSVAESLLDTLLAMLRLDFVGIRFVETSHIFHRMGPDLTNRQDRDGLLADLSAWTDAVSGQVQTHALSNGADMRLRVLPLGGIASMGMLVAGSLRANFPNRDEQLILTVAATQAGLACRELRELNDREPPEDLRPEKPTGAALAASEWKLNLIINTIPAMAWSASADGLLDFGNQHFLDFVGSPFDAIEGLNFYRIFHPDDVPHLLAAWQEIMASKRSREVDGRIRRADGEYRWCTLRQKPLLDAEGNVIKWYGVVLEIEDRKRAENALEAARSALLASERNLALIINSLPVLVWSARPDGSADFVNQRWLEYAGLAAEKILEWGFLHLYHPDDIDGMVEIWKHDLEFSDQTSLKGRILGADGQYRWFYFRGRKLTDANGVVRWFGANVDIEDLQRAEDALRASEAALRESERQLQQIISSIPGLAWSSDTNGATTFWSQQYLDYAGARSEDVLGFGFVDYIHPDDRERVLEVWSATLQSGKPGEAEARLRRSDGVFRWFLIRASPFHDSAGTLVQWFGVNVDIEDRKRAEEELRQSETELAHVSRMTTMGELAVSIAHEINQPLMAIVTNAGTCLRWLNDAQLDLPLARQAAERVVRDGHRAGDIIASIRALARKSPPNMELIALEQVIESVLGLLRGELARREIVASTEFPDAPTWVMGDTTQLQQVMLNLIMNSADAMSSIDAAGRRLTLRTQRLGYRVQVCVVDSGIGIGADHLDQVFEPFFSLKPDGIGMGLSICRSIVEAHGGRIRASANAPAGSVFSFTLPVSEGESRDAEPR